MSQHNNKRQLENPSSPPLKRHKKNPQDVPLKGKKNTLEKQFIKSVNVDKDKYLNLRNRIKKMKKAIRSGTQNKDMSKEKVLELEEESREKLKALVGRLKGNMKALARKRVGSVLLQTVLKYCDDELQKEIFDELKPHLEVLSTDPYGSHLVLGLTRASPALFDGVAEFVYANAPRLLTLQDSCKVVDQIFTHKNINKRLMMRGFLGSERHEDDVVDKLKNSSIDDLNLKKYCDENPEKAFVVQRRLANTVSKACDKELIPHFSALQFLANQVFDIARPDRVRFLVSDLVEQLEHFAHTKDGCQIAIKCVHYGRAPERKTILKHFKDYAMQAASEQTAFQVLCALADVTDDTKRSFKSIYRPLLAEVSNALNDPHASKVLSFPFLPCHKSIFTPQQIDLIRLKDHRTDIYPEDSDLHDIHKKSKDDIHQELREKLYLPLLNEFAASTEQYLSLPHNYPLFTKLMQMEPSKKEANQVEGSKATIWENLYNLIVNELTSDGLLSNISFHMLLKDIFGCAGSESLSQKLIEFIKTLDESDLKTHLLQHHFGVVVGSMMQQKIALKDVKPLITKSITKAAKKHDKKSNFGCWLMMHRLEK